MEMNSEAVTHNTGNQLQGGVRDTQEGIRRTISVRTDIIQKSIYYKLSPIRMLLLLKVNFIS